MNIAWLSDPHLDHCDEPRRRRFLADLAAATDGRPGFEMLAIDRAAAGWRLCSVPDHRRAGHAS